MSDTQKTRAYDALAERVRVVLERRRPDGEPVFDDSQVRPFLFWLWLQSDLAREVVSRLCDDLPLLVGESLVRAGVPRHAEVAAVGECLIGYFETNPLSRALVQAVQEVLGTAESGRQTTAAGEARAMANLLGQAPMQMRKPLERGKGLLDLRVAEAKAMFEKK